MYEIIPTFLKALKIDINFVIRIGYKRYFLPLGLKFKVKLKILISHKK